MPLLEELEPVEPPKKKRPVVIKSSDKSAYNRQLREVKQQRIATVCEYLEDHVQDLPEEILEIVRIWRNPKLGHLGNKSMFYKIFGDAPRVGDCVTMKVVFNITTQGVSYIKKLIRQWKKKSIAVVEYVPDLDIPGNSMCVIKSIG